MIYTSLYAFDDEVNLSVSRITAGENEPLLSNGTRGPTDSGTEDSYFRTFLHAITPIDTENWSEMSVFKKTYEIFKVHLNGLQKKHEALLLSLCPRSSVSVCSSVRPHFHFKREFRNVLSREFVLHTQMADIESKAPIRCGLKLYRSKSY